MNEPAAILHALAWLIFGFGGLAMMIAFMFMEIIDRRRARRCGGSLSSANLHAALGRRAPALRD